MKNYNFIYLLVIFKILKYYSWGLETSLVHKLLFTLNSEMRNFQNLQINFKLFMPQIYIHIVLWYVIITSELIYI